MKPLQHSLQPLPLFNPLQIPNFTSHRDTPPRLSDLPLEKVWFFLHLPNITCDLTVCTASQQFTHWCKVTVVDQLISQYLFYHVSVIHSMVACWSHLIPPAGPLRKSSELGHDLRVGPKPNAHTTHRECEVTTPRLTSCTYLYC